MMATSSVMAGTPFFNVLLRGPANARLVDDAALNHVDSPAEGRVLSRRGAPSAVGHLERVGHRGIGQRVGRRCGGTAPGMFDTQ